MKLSGWTWLKITLIRSSEAVCIWFLCYCPVRSPREILSFLKKQRFLPLKQKKMKKKFKKQAKKTEIQVTDFNATIKRATHCTSFAHIFLLIFPLRMEINCETFVLQAISQLIWTRRRYLHFGKLGFFELMGLSFFLLFLNGDHVCILPILCIFLFFSLLKLMFLIRK